jgi:hypothetical protein
MGLYYVQPILEDDSLEMKRGLQTCYSLIEKPHLKTK